MSVLFQKVINTGRLCSYRNFIKSVSSCRCLAIRKLSDVPRKFINFEEVVAARRAEARRSVVVQVNSEASFSELHSYCSKYADVKGIHHYRNSSGEHFMLIEFSTEDNLKDVLRSCSSHQKDIDVMSLRSPFLWFRAAPGKKEKTEPCLSSLNTKDGSSDLSEDTLFQELMSAQTVSDQIQLLYDRTILNDLGVRLRFIVARELEVMLESLYANIEVHPFGSSVNGFGRMGCDLDLVLTNTLTNDMMDPSKRLVYQEKRNESRPARQLELLAELLDMRAVGVARVQRILHARVPIVKFAHHITDVDCDLCYSNMSGVYMSELLHLLGSLDARARPLTLAVRRWAAAAQLTAAAPGRWITNFPLTLLVLHFLQQAKVLPSVKLLVSKAEKEDIRIAEDNLNCTFLRDANKLPPSSYSQNDAPLETLLLQFFEFYAQFDFADKAISLNEGAAVRKPNALPLYIVNPLEQALNVSRNVSYEECERLKMEVRNAAWQLEAGLEGDKTDDWGLLGLIEKKSTRGLKKLLRVGNSQRLVSVKDLFTNEEDNQPVGNDIKDKLDRLASKGRNEKVDKSNVKFKNSQVASQVYRIRRGKLL
ncbi:poly(A) RNA polymerase, mitochondrial [Cydia pomonella]|uniref:poly(A) RNA polymerase, mitochondrial n=1 Tax=Cydia pomonella TaxID=82600 RepID=UPI002ADE753C|nr:poly(A) RNA polymerase, mitochondrial [Cydia pomonella]